MAPGFIYLSPEHKTTAQLIKTLRAYRRIKSDPLLISNGHGGSMSRAVWSQLGALLKLRRLGKDA